MRPIWFTTLVWIFALAFASAAVVAARRDYLNQRPAQALAEMTRDEGLRGDARFSRLRPALPPFGLVGYFAASTGNPGADDQHFILAQYALAPLILRRDTQARFIAANFPTGQSLREAIRATPALRIVWEDPRVPGLAVLENAAPPDPNAPPAPAPGARP